MGYYKMTWDIWVNNNWEILKYWAKKWHWEEADELAQLLIIYIQKNWTSFQTIPDGDERIKFCQSWYKNNVGWSNSEFNKIISAKTTGDEEIFEPIGHCKEKINGKIIWTRLDEVEYLDLQNDIEIELCQSGYTEVDISKLRSIKKIYYTLADDEKILFNLYFTEMLSIRAIASKCDLPMSAVFNLLTALKNKIKNGIDC